ncbi:ABC transporter ATP-binding protein [Arthrobacter gandavensis]|uniref:sulfate/molybdate ABC transporter ATP-binding protein n=1 Tax=Arthrobacter gandavensis TaxID=169960 RepID=UPI00188F2BAF|nr:ABC transporter ATP-binding protein [Arthrobacter gandavensis]MBF4995032.1 ABC transporter ATP-binding protein [Arthrobacter gandavensis]
MALRMRAELPGRRIDVAFDIGDGETVALLGPNGAGKSTVVSLLAGLIDAERGRAELNGTTLFSLSNGRGVSLPAYRRGTSLLAQEALLFPHLSAEENVAFGPRSMGTGRKAARAAARRWLAETDASALAAKRPGELSGGQAQRVALARALAAEPDLLLLDEPMAALDVETVPLMRRLLKRVLAGRSALIVTHDVLDALTLADRVLVMQEGQIVESGPPAEVLRRPQNPFMASLAGLNLVRGTASGGRLLAPGGLEFPVPDAGAAPQAGVPHLAVFPPSALAVRRPGARAGALPGREILDVTITDLEPQGDRIRVRGAGLAADISPAAAAELSLGVGERAQFLLDSSAVTSYPALAVPDRPAG